MIMHKINDSLYAFFCPACNSTHAVDIRMWGFNGDINNPTITPSIKVEGTVPITSEEADFILKGGKFTPKPLLCHSFVKDGNIQYLSDCSHTLKGKTVRLPEWENRNIK